MDELESLIAELKEIGGIGNSADFFERFLLVYDFPKATIAKLNLKVAAAVRTGIQITNKIFYLDVTENNLYSAFGILQRNGLAKIKSRFIIVTNATRLLAYDLKTADTIEIQKIDLYKHFAFFFPLMGKEKSVISIIDKVNINIAKEFAELYREICTFNPIEAVQVKANNFLCFLLFAAFADSKKLLAAEPGVLANIIKNYSNENAKDLNQLFGNILSAMSSRSRGALPTYLQGMSHCTDKLTAWDFSGLSFNIAAREHIIRIFSLDWADVSPETIGALLQTVMVPSTGGEFSNYTPTTNIRKLLSPLFLDELYAEYESIKGDDSKLLALADRIAKIKMFDPSCGAGNYLVVSFRELNDLMRLIQQALPTKTATPLIAAQNFVGISSDVFSAQMARLSLFIAFVQENPTMPLTELFSLAFTESIVVGSTVRLNWETVCPHAVETYIIGNPDYCGARKQTIQQKEDVAFVFREYERISNLDYASCWFLLAAKYIKGRKGGFAFVSTNSISQGQQVALLWPKVFNEDVYIQFGYTAFKWRNDARNQSCVTVVIIGMRPYSDKRDCLIYDNGSILTVNSISPYLKEGGPIVSARTVPLSHVLPKMVKGNMPYDEGLLLLSTSDKAALLKEFPSARKFIKRFCGSMEFIRGTERWCLWLPNDSLLSEAMAIPFIAKRINATKELRARSTDPAVKRLAERPHQFREINETKEMTLIVPCVSSENSAYLPIGFVYSDTIVSNLATVVYDCEEWLFAVAASRMHNLWCKYACGQHEARPRFSHTLGYNTFPFPNITKGQKELLIQLTRNLIAEREKQSEKTIAQMYYQNKMSDGLRQAHGLIDVAIEKCYRDTPFVSDEERMEVLFSLYEVMINAERK